MFGSASRLSGAVPVKVRGTTTATGNGAALLDDQNYQQGGRSREKYNEPHRRDCHQRQQAAPRPLVDLDSPVVSLRGFGIDGGVSKELCEALRKSEVLCSLDLGRNSLGDGGAEHVAALLSSNPGLTSLGLAHNGLSDWGVAHVARACRRHNTIVSLDVSGNPIGDAALADVGRLVQGSKTLQELVLTDTNVTFAGAVDFAEVMLENESLQYVSLPFSLGFALQEEVQRILRRNWEKSRAHDAQVDLATALLQRAAEQERLRQQTWGSDERRDDIAREQARLSVASAPLASWCNPQLASSLMFLAVLDRKSSVRAEEHAERESQRNLSRMAVVSPRAYKAALGGTSLLGPIPPASPRRNVAGGPPHRLPPLLGAAPAFGSAPPPPR